MSHLTESAHCKSSRKIITGREEVEMALMNRLIVSHNEKKFTSPWLSVESAKEIAVSEEGTSRRTSGTVLTRMCRFEPNSETIAFQRDIES